MSSLIDPTAFQAGVWANAPLIERQFDQSLAVLLDEQFQTYNATATTGDWVATAVTSGTAAADVTAPGGLLLDSGATTATQGIQIQRLKSPFFPAANKSIWAEFVLTLTAATPPVTKGVIFVGLAESDTTIFASGSITTANHIGWAIQTTELLALTFRSNKATVEATKTGLTVVAATQFKVGFRYDGVADTVQQYVNGVATGTAVATASVPKVVLYPSIACLSDGVDRPKLLVSGCRILQLR